MICPKVLGLNHNRALHVTLRQIASTLVPRAPPNAISIRAERVESGRPSESQNPPWYELVAC